jgi:hypothetical protein
MMSIDEKEIENGVDAVMVRLLAGGEPSQAMLERSPTLERWRLSVADASGGSRAIFIHGEPASDRFKVSILQYKGGWRVLWIDRRWRFVLTRNRLWNLGARGADAT